jgi:hypothetical protein
MVTRQSIFCIYRSVLATALVAVLAGFSGSAEAKGIKFEPPGDTAPSTSVGGAVRGKVQFSAPGEASPVSSIGGGVRGKVQFAPPGEFAPIATVSGGIRGNIQFSAPNAPTPSATTAGGVRGGETLNLNLSQADLSLNPSITVLLPQNSPVGRTVSARPTLYFYVPSTAARQAFFSIQDEQGNPLYHTTVSLSGNQGIIHVTLPAEAPELEIGKNYVSFFVPIEPDDVLRPDSYSVTAWIKRVNPSDRPDNMLSPIDQAGQYAAQGVWYDTLNILASAYATDPGNPSIVQEWQDLLKQVGLGNIADQPITPVL